MPNHFIAARFQTRLINFFLIRPSRLGRYNATITRRRPTTQDWFARWRATLALWRYGLVRKANSDQQGGAQDEQHDDR